ncbi:hypothetical protein NPIL_331151 [Nephila pilipes]|uniref:Uncharacterized protein n=1 Tax=Nephila pilipes TaxID=299642 RepID=A0A8X6TQH3_NEPPI|nr:hypothetical protein NPIL_331151 [Nephila pilipes]
MITSSFKKKKAILCAEIDVLVSEPEELLDHSKQKNVHQEMAQQEMQFISAETLTIGKKTRLVCKQISPSHSAGFQNPFHSARASLSAGTPMSLMDSISLWLLP